MALNRNVVVADCAQRRCRCGQQSCKVSRAPLVALAKNCNGIRDGVSGKTAWCTRLRTNFPCAGPYGSRSSVGAALPLRGLRAIGPAGGTNDALRAQKMSECVHLCTVSVSAAHVLQSARLVCLLPSDWARRPLEKCRLWQAFSPSPDRLSSTNPFSRSPPYHHGIGSRACSNLGCALYTIQAHLPRLARPSLAAR